MKRWFLILTVVLLVSGSIFGQANSDERMLSGMWASTPHDQWPLQAIIGGSTVVMIFNSSTKICQIGVKNYYPFAGIYIEGDNIVRPYSFGVNTMRKEITITDEFGDSFVLRYILSVNGGQAVLKLKDAGGIITDLYKWE